MKISATSKKNAKLTCVDVLQRIAHIADVLCSDFFAQATFLLDAIVQRAVGRCTISENKRIEGERR